MKTIETRLNEKTNKFYEVEVAAQISTPEKREKAILKALKAIFRAKLIHSLTYYKETSYNLDNIPNSIYWHYYFELEIEDLGTGMQCRQNLTIDDKGRIDISLHPIFVL